MPIARIRTSDPEAISFLAAKLAESGFQVQFAVPGERVSGDVDLDITVSSPKKSIKALGKNLVAVPSPAVGAWTTPYHVEAPEISDTGELGDECTNLDIPWNDRELARILATGTQRTHVQSVEGEVQTREEIADAEVGASSVLRIVEDREPAIVSQSLVPEAKPNRVLRVVTRAQGFPQHSFRQRFASIAAIVTLAVTAVFSLTLSGDRPYPSRETGTYAAQPSPALPAPISAVALPVVPVTATELVPVVSSTPEPSATATNNDLPRTGHAKHHARRASRARKLHRPVQDPEVIVRHFPTTAEQ